MDNGEKMIKNWIHNISNNMSAMGSETIIANCCQEDVAGQGKTETVLQHTDGSS